VLVAIDDLQWLDPSSARVVAFVARRFSGPVGLLATVRTDDGDNDVSWLQLEQLDARTRILLGPLSIGGLHQVVSARLGRSISRQTMLRIHEASGGNPFYALELGARDDGTTIRERADAADHVDRIGGIEDRLSSTPTFARPSSRRPVWPRRRSIWCRRPPAEAVTTAYNCCWPPKHRASSRSTATD